MDKKNLIKNILIIFLIIMLVLTFFSNTIMNSSLPEVATQYASYKQISDKIRGSATVMSKQDYSLVWDEAREIVEVLVRRGDRVERGQVLYILDETDSSALTEAQTQLNNLLIQKQQMLIENNNATDKDYSYDIEQKKELVAELKAKLESVPGYDAQLELLEEQLEEMNEQLEMLNGKMSRYEATYDTLEEINAQLALDREEYGTNKALYEQSKEKYDQNEAELERLELEKETLQEQIDTTNRKKLEYEEKLGLLNSDDATLLALQTKVSEARAALHSIEREYHFFTAMKEAERALNSASPEEYEQAENAYVEACDRYNEITGGVTRSEKEYLDLIDARTIAEQEATALYESFSSESGEASTYQSKVNKLETNLSKYNLEMDDINRSVDKITKEQNKLTPKLNEAETDMKEAEAKVKSGESKIEYLGYKEQIDVLKDEIKAKNKELKKQSEDAPGDQKTLKQELRNAEKELEALEKEASAQDKNQGYSQAIRDLQLQNMNASIERQQKEVNRLRENLVEKEIISPVSGTITDLPFSAGEDIPAGSEVAKIALSEKGYTMEYAVTNEQAMRIRVGDNVELTSYYYGTKPEVRVDALKNDTSNPGRGKIVVMSVIGDDITAGQTLNFAIGDKSRSYDKVVPSSAIREDANGKFVLVVDSKSTPLGNRYTARRVDVEIITSDETSSALSGELMGGEFIITTSSSPVSDGMQVRLADKN